MVSLLAFYSALKTIHIVRRKIDQDKKLTVEENQISVSIGVAIVYEGIDPEKLKTPALMAVIFVVNYIAKSDPAIRALAYAKKDALQLALAKRRDVQRCRGKGRFRRTIEFKRYPFTSHMPERLLRKAEKDQQACA